MSVNSIQKTPISPPSYHEQVQNAAEAMESAFVEQMIQTMRNTVEPSEFSLENSATKIYQSMLDSEHAKTMAKAQNLGLAELIVAYMDPSHYNKNEKNSISTGGTDAHTKSESIARKQHDVRRLPQEGETK